MGKVSRRGAVDLQPIFKTTWDEKLAALRERFGPSCAWREIAEWTMARANADPPLPAWQIGWAREFLENWRRTGSEAA